jgi:hypothetical protein
MRGVQRGIECSCTLDACNGDDDLMITAEYSAFRDLALYGGASGDGGVAVDIGAKRKPLLASKLGNSGAAAATMASLPSVLACILLLIFHG